MLKRSIALGGLAVLGGLIVAASAQETVWIHGATLVGEPKYEAGFAHFDYVNPHAPKGGLVRLSVIGSFDNLNPIPDAGILAAGTGLLYETLMTGNLDEPLSQYGLLAEGFIWADDFTWAIYKLREDAYWHDGVPITVADVIWSYEVQTDNSPGLAAYYSHVVAVEQTGEWEITFTFDGANNSELPIIVGQFSIFPKHYWEGTDADGEPRDFLQPTLDPPLGSGPYRIKTVDAGRTIAYERVEDYWGATLNVNVGHYNFDEIRYEYFLDETVQLEAFKADEYDFRTESIARVWANEYNFPAANDGRVILEWFEPEVSSGLMVGYYWNTRREKFQDPRVRWALTLAYPFESVNRDLFYSQYVRLSSFWDGIELAAIGTPEGRELEILETVRDLVPPEVFGPAYQNPVSSTPEELRENLRTALGLLNDAGWVLDGNTLVNAETGEPFIIEFVNRQPSLEPQALRYQEELRKIGIDFQIRTMDTSQWVNQVRAMEFDTVYSGRGQSLSPGNELYAFFGSQTAYLEGTVNLSGIDNPAVDALIELIVAAPDRDELVAATKALDRILMWNYYVTPGWTLRAIRAAFWDRFARPDPLPTFSIGFPTVWWYDDAKADQIGRAR